MNDFCVGSKDVAGFGEHLWEHVRSANQDHITFGCNGQAETAKDMPCLPLIERVGVAHIEVAFISPPHLGADQFCQTDKFMMGVRLGDAIADEDKGALCIGK